MPTSTPRSFGRTGGGATTPRRTPTRTTARTTQPAGRFGRSTAPTPRARPSIRRKPQPQSKGQQVLKALSSVPAGKAAGKAKNAAGKPPKGLLILGAAGGLAAALKKRQAAKSQTTETVVVPAEPVPAPSVTSVPEPSPVEVRADGTL
jgi:hypothetical protein